MPELYPALRSGGSGNGRVEAELRPRASLEPEDVSAFQRKVAFDEDCALDDVYLALADDATNHLDLLLSELDRLLAVAAQNPGNRWVFDQLMAYEFIGGPDSLERGIVAAILKALGSPVPQVRRCAAALADGFVTDSEPELEVKLRDVHRGDSDWRVRALAFQSLSDLRDEDPAFVLPDRAIGDRIRWMFSGASVRDYSA